MWYWFEQKAIEGCARARAVMEQELYYTLLVRHGGDRRVKKIVRDRARERRRKQRDIASEESKAKAKNLTDTRMTLHGSLSETLQNTALPSSLLYLVPST